jgi:hypothetical protein
MRSSATTSLNGVPERRLVARDEVAFFWKTWVADVIMPTTYREELQHCPDG